MFQERICFQDRVVRTVCEALEIVFMDELLLISKRVEWKAINSVRGQCLKYELKRIWVKNLKGK